MDEPLTPLGDLAATIARRQDLELSRVPMERTKERLLTARPRRRRLGKAIALAAAAAIALALVVVLRRPSPLVFELGPGTAGRVGAWIDVALGAELPVRFSDGSTFALASESRARVTEVEAGGASMILERGSVEATVVHRPGARWRLDVGPFAVHVIGTRFRVRWDPDGKSIDVDMYEGSVLVEGPLLGGGRSVVAGERLGVWMNDQRVVQERGPRPTSELAASGAPTVAAAPIAPSESASAHPPSPAAASARPAEPTPATWRELAAAGWYAQALARAEAAGFDEICASAGPADLMALADAARLAGSTRRSKQALLSMTRRFSDDAQASVATFLLGRIAFDQEGAFSEAERWFTSYLKMAPAGPFAREALGRQMEARARMGDRVGATAAAHDYLRRYPDGPYAEKARQLARE